MSFAIVQSYHDSSCVVSPASSMAKRSLPKVTSTRPSGAMSSRVNVPGTRKTSCSLPETSTLHSARFSPPCTAVNQISFPFTSHASPEADAHPVDNCFFCPLRSTTHTAPRSSNTDACSINAMRSPLGEKRTSLMPPALSYSTLPIGYSSRLRPPTSCTAAKPPFLSQSAEFTLTNISRGAPPASGALASVPLVICSFALCTACNESASSSDDEIASKYAGPKSSGRASGASDKVEYSCTGFPFHDAAYTTDLPSGANLAE